MILQSCLNMNIVTVDNGGENRYLRAVNTTMDFLLRGGACTTLGSYAFFSFYEKVKKKDFKKGTTSTLGRTPHPREPLHELHPQFATSVLKRMDPPRVPKISGSIPARPSTWFKPGFFEGCALPPSDNGEELDRVNAPADPDEEELRRQEEYALFVMALFRDIHDTRPIPIALERTWWAECKQWWMSLHSGPNAGKCGPALLLMFVDFGSRRAAARSKQLPQVSLLVRTVH